MHILKNDSPSFALGHQWNTHCKSQHFTLDFIAWYSLWVALFSEYQALHICTFTRFAYYLFCCLLISLLFVFLGQHLSSISGYHSHVQFLFMHLLIWSYLSLLECNVNYSLFMYKSFYKLMKTFSIEWTVLMRIHIFSSWIGPLLTKWRWGIGPSLWVEWNSLPNAGEYIYIKHDEFFIEIYIL